MERNLCAVISDSALYVAILLAVAKFHLTHLPALFLR